MRVLCVSFSDGVGGVGGVICTKLAQSGQNVVAIARGEHLAAIRQKGLRLRTPAEDVTLPILAVNHPSELEPPLGGEDAVVISVKAHQALDVLTVIASLTAGDEPTIICCTNGINTEHAALRCEDGPRRCSYIILYQASQCGSAAVVLSLCVRSRGARV